MLNMIKVILHMLRKIERFFDRHQFQPGSELCGRWRGGCLEYLGQNRKRLGNNLQEKDCLCQGNDSLMTFWSDCSFYFLTCTMYRESICDFFLYLCRFFNGNIHFEVPRTQTVGLNQFLSVCILLSLCGTGAVAKDTELMLFKSSQNLYSRSN